MLFRYSYHPGRSFPVADALIKFKEFKITEATIKNVTLIEPNTGQKNGVVRFEMEITTPQQAALYDEHTVFEYQRWEPIKGWGSTYPGHLLPTDPGCWSTVNGQKFANKLIDVSPGILEGWKIDRQWHYLATDDDPDGWQYAVDFISSRWFPSNGSGLYVRRRAWRREISKVNANESSSTNSPTYSVRRGKTTLTDDD